MPEHASRFAGLYDQQNENRIADWGGDELFTRMPRPRAVDDAPAPRFRAQLALVDAPEDRRRTPPSDEWSGRRDRRRSQTAEAAMVQRAERLGLSVVEQDSVAGWDAAEWAAATRERDDDASQASIDGGRRWDAATREREDDASPRGTGDERRWEADARGQTADAIVRQWDADGMSDQWDAIMAPPAEERAANGRRTKVITGRPDRAPRPLALVPAERRRPPRTPAEWIGPRPERIMAWAFVLCLLLILIAISTADAATL